MRKLELSDPHCSTIMPNRYNNFVIEEETPLAAPLEPAEESSERDRGAPPFVTRCGSSASELRVSEYRANRTLKSGKAQALLSA